MNLSHSRLARHRWLALLAMLAALWPGLPSHAVKPANVGAGEIAMLPPYCIDTEGFMHGPENSPTQSPRAHEWVSRMGRSFWTMHHYCWGLVNLNRLRFGRTDTNNKRYFAKQIVDEFTFVLQRSSPDFILLPEIWTRIGEASLLAGDIGAAMDAYAKARSLRPDYAPAYAQWAEFQMNNGRRSDAKTLVEEGLQHIPDSKPLLDLRRKLGATPAGAPRTPTTPKPAAGKTATHDKAPGDIKAP